MEIEMENVNGNANANAVKRLPPWTAHITCRGVVASTVIGVVYSVIVTKLNLTTGLVPNLNVSAALLAFVFIKTWTKLIHKAGFVTTPFTRQENTIIQTLCCCLLQHCCWRWIWVLSVGIKQEDI
ncbi:unnamed protein product [Lactuca virosa]|uniref:Uncharacterized protein n=1 Tax=Lactuca virosa TaxID=75947 RepID=A0AAU9NAR2_9ASTR|nr:unnamed protein product [Lactuca virosa]